MIYLKIILGFVVILLSNIISGIDYLEIEKTNKPCSFFDTINITDGIKYSNGSISYNGITYKSNQYKTFNYIYLQHDIRKSSIPHIRGCFCYHRICIKSCCPKGYILNNGCISSTDPQKMQKFHVNLKLKNNKTKIVNLYNNSKYGVTYIKPCYGYLLEPEKNAYDQWYLVAFKTHIKMLVDDDNLMFDNSKFCLALNENFSVVAAACAFKLGVGSSNKLIEFILPYCMFNKFTFFFK